MVQKNKSLTIVRDIRNGDWYWISRKIYSDYTPKIGVIGLALYNAYASHAMEKENVFPSQKRLAKTLGVTIPTIVKYNKILEDNGLIKIESGKEKGDVNIVYLLKLKGIKQVKTPSKPGLDQGINEVKSEKEKEEKEKTKDISSKEDTQKEKKEYGNKDINELIGLLKEKIGLPVLDGSNPNNRRFCYLLLRKFGYDKNPLKAKNTIIQIIEAGCQDKFHCDKMTSFRYIFYNAVNIIASAQKGRKQGIAII